MSAVAGVLNASVDGGVISVRGTCTVHASTEIREGIESATGTPGYKVTSKVPAIEFEADTVADLDLNALAAIVDGTIQVDAVNGWSHVLLNAWCTNGFEINVIEGTVPIRFEGLNIRSYET
jgi:hypothetical protein